jgi:hypothetical protein
LRKSSLVNPSIAASVLALALFVPAPQAAAQDRNAPEAPVAAGVSVANDPAVRDALARLDVWLEGQRYRFDLPGFAVGVVHDQQPTWRSEFRVPTRRSIASPRSARPSLRRR